MLPGLADRWQSRGHRDGSASGGVRTACLTAVSVASRPSSSNRSCRIGARASAAAIASSRDPGRLSSLYPRCCAMREASALYRTPPTASRLRLGALVVFRWRSTYVLADGARRNECVSIRRLPPTTRAANGTSYSCASGTMIRLE